jgi:DNA-binding CsgD family transcriptional regulator
MTQRFAARFGLTAGETRILAEIIGGNGLLAAAAKLKITEATARTHAQRILAKTETNRQTELIRRFFATSLPGSPGGAQISEDIKPLEPGIPYGGWSGGKHVLCFVP